MKKLYFIIYSIIFFFAIFFLGYIAFFDAGNNTREYVSSDDILLWDNYELNIDKNIGVLEGDISVTPNINNVLSFYSIHQNIAVYCDGLLIYKYPVKNNNPFAVTPGYNWNFVSLPKSDSHLLIHITSPYNGYTEQVPTFYIGSVPAVYSKILEENLFSFLLCVIIFCIGLFMVLYWVYIRLHVPIKLNLLHLGVFAICLSVWSGNESQFTTLLLKNNLICSYIAFISLMMLPLPFAFFVRAYYEDDSKIWDMFCIANVIQISFCFFLQLFGIEDFRITLWTTHVMVFTLMMIVLSISIKLLRTRENSENVKMHLLCISICTITLGIDLIAFYLHVWDSNSFGRIGFLLYIILIGISSAKESTALMKLGQKANTYQHLAYTDLMTKMSNRTAFHRDYNIFSSSPNDIGIIILDLNNLKQINDTLGHNLGDEYITNSANIISNTFANVGKCYRVGGDEFVIIIEKASHFDFKYYFNLMEWSIDSFNAKKKDFHIQIAYGYAIYDAAVDDTLDDTYQKADKNMYINKKEKKKIRS